MEENAVRIAVQYLPFVSRMAIQVVDGFPEAVLGYFNHRVSNLRARHPARKCSARVSEHHIHKQLQSQLPLLQNVLYALLVIKLA